MSNLVRVFPPDSGPATHVVNGRQYVGVAGTAQSVEEMDALELEANGWTRVGKGFTGTTAQRTAYPNPQRGDTWYDTTLSIPMIYTGANWRRQTTGATS